jgi:hypothetical protein
MRDIISIDEGGVNKEKKPTILEEYNRWKDVPPKIYEKQPLALEEIARKEGCDIFNLETDIQTKVKRFADDMKKECSFPSREYVGLIDSLYNLYLQSKNLDIVKENPWLNYFNSYNEFANHFCPEATPHSRAYIQKNIQRFVETIVNQEKIISTHPNNWFGVNKDGFRETYNNDKDWILLPDEYYNLGVYEFTDKEVITEIIELIKTKYHHSDFTHSSGSAALNGIEKKGAILSAQNIESEGIKVATGEHVSYVNSESGVPVAGGKYGLGSVYASSNGPLYGYHHLNWFDEHPIAFGINKQKQEDFLRQIGFKYEIFSSEDNPVLTMDLGGEGIKIGSQVPLNNVEIVYCWKKYQNDMEIWAKKNCPQAKLVSLEADEILRSYNYKIKEMAEQEGISIEDAWKKLL